MDFIVHFLRDDISRTLERIDSKQSYSTTLPCIQLNIDKMCISKPGSKPVYREGLESGVNVQLELGS